MIRPLCIFILFGFLHFCEGQSKGGCWEFENNGFDTADWDTMDDTGSLMNTATYGDSLPLQQGNYYLRLDANQNTDYFKVDDSNDLDFNNENIGISAWIYPVVINDVHFIINKGQQDTNPKTTNYALRISLSQHLEFLIRDANNQAQTVASSFTIPLNQWTFIAAYYNYTAGKVYFWNTPSAQAVDTLNFNQNLLTNNHPLSIGGWYSAGTTVSKPFKGRIDDVRISGRIEDIIPGWTAIRPDPSPQAGSDQFNLFPNPVYCSKGINQLKVKLSTLEPQPITLAVFNILGQKLYGSRIFINATNYEFLLNLSEILGDHYSAGFYFIQMNGKDLRQIKKFLIIK